MRPPPTQIMDIKGKTADDAIELLSSSSDESEDEVEVIKIVANGDGNSKVKAETDEPGNSTAATASTAAVHSEYRFIRPSVGTTFTCPICYCDGTSDESVLLTACNHVFCQDCFSQYVRTKTKDGEVLPEQLVCPYVVESLSAEPSAAAAQSKRCGIQLSQKDVLACLETPSDRDRYLRLSLDRAVDGEDNLACCPTAGCAFQFEWDEENRKLDCPLCRQTYCLVCRAGPWHSGMRCEVYQQRRRERQRSSDGGGEDDTGEDDDAEFQKFASKQKLKQCPKCRFWVEKSEGCNAMYCRCKLVFCYVCGGCQKGTAKKNNFQMCRCGDESQTSLAAHEGAYENVGRNRLPMAAGMGMGMGMGMGIGMGMGMGGVIAIPPPNHPARGNFGDDGGVMHPFTGKVIASEMEVENPRIMTAARNRENERGRMGNEQWTNQVRERG